MSRLFDKNAIEDIDREKEQWEKEVYQPAEGEEKVFETLSGIPVEPLYTPAHTAGMDYLNDLGFPGQEPYVRGVHPTMYRGRNWTLRQLAGFGPPEETNKRYKFLLKEGATGING
ncbi:MAG: methylmalonyl-CoA mutase, partial [Deltaproteobacteria bacterium]|nr:methylmalonyl-CoA mutase [Deltaproteobacteria bacterium]